MKTKILLSFITFVFIYNCGWAQEGIIPRTIEVVGSAEMPLKSENIELRIDLYYHHEEKTRKKQEKEFFEILDKYKINKKDVVNTVYGQYRGYWYWSWYYYWDYYWYNNARYDSYLVPIDSKIEPKELLGDLKKSFVRNVRIVEGTVKNATEYRKQVKIEAIKAAKNKAEYLLEAVGEKLGGVISIVELTPTSKNTRRVGGWHPYWGWDHYGYNQGPNISANTSNTVVQSNQNQDNTVANTPSQKLKYEVKVIFKIK